MTTVTSLMLGTTDVERLHQWYAAVLPPDTDEPLDKYRLLGYGGFYLFLDPRDDVDGPNKEPGRFLVNVEVDDARAAEKRADDLGATWISRVEDRDGSLFGTLADPDGNAVQIIQLSPEQRAQMAARTTPRMAEGPR